VHYEKLAVRGVRINYWMGTDDPAPQSRPSLSGFDERLTQIARHAVRHVPDALL
jgi:hypothetical protein